MRRWGKDCEEVGPGSHKPYKAVRSLALRQMRTKWKRVTDHMRLSRRLG